LDNQRFSRIAHTHLLYAAPIAAVPLFEALDVIAVSPVWRVLDAGCGRGGLLLDILAHYGCRGTGIDLDNDAIATAQREAKARGLDGQASFEAVNARKYDQSERFDLAMCIGASHAYENYESMLAHLSGLIRATGYLLIGEGFWRKPPDDAYLEGYGLQADEMQSHAANARRAHAAGLEVIWSMVSRDEDWDRYEGLYRLSMAMHLRQTPDDPDHAAFAKRSSEWYDGYLRHGRETMGFSLYLMQRTANPAATN
jgi:SAM-dependent methyltransferase